MTGFRGHYPTKIELAAMAGAISDLGRFTDYATLLGTAATPAETFADALTTGVEWRSQRDSAEAWEAYAKAQDALAWKTAMTMMDEVKPLFLLAASKDATLVSTYPRLAQLLDAGKVIAKQANATKQKNAKTKAVNAAAAAKAATDAATASAVAAATAAGEAAGKAAAATTAVTPGSSVTVNA
jgi:hypothetical protein